MLPVGMLGREGMRGRAVLSRIYQTGDWQPGEQTGFYKSSRLCGVLVSVSWEQSSREESAPNP
jgi:hypothetical protein